MEQEQDQEQELEQDQEQEQELELEQGHKRREPREEQEQAARLQEGLFVTMTTVLCIALATVPCILHCIYRAVSITMGVIKLLNCSHSLN